MGKMGVERKGEPCIQGALVSNARKFTNLAPVSNFLHHSNISRLGRTVISHTLNVCRESLFLAPTVYESGRDAISAEETLCFGAHPI